MELNDDKYTGEKIYWLDHRCQNYGPGGQMQPTCQLKLKLSTATDCITSYVE